MTLARVLAPLQRRIQLMLARAVIAGVNDGARAQALQIDLLADETQDDVERFQDYGFTSVPLPGAEALVAFVGGLRSHGVVVAIEDRRYRLVGLAGGEVALYDDQDQRVHLARDGIRITTTRDVAIVGETVSVEASSATITADSVALGGAGGRGVARIGDTVANGVIVSGSTKVTAA